MELFDRLDEVALAVDEDDGSVLVQIVNDHRVQQGGLAAARRRDDPMTSETGFFGE